MNSIITIVPRRFTIEVQSMSREALHTMDIDNVYTLSTLIYKEGQRLVFVDKWYLTNKISAYYIQSNHDNPKYYVRLCQLKVR